MYEDDEEQDQTKAPGMRGSDPAPEQRVTTMMNGSQPTPEGMRTMSAGGAMGGRFGGGWGGPQGGQPMQMPWQRGPQQGQPDWGSIVQRFRDRFSQHNPFARMMQGGAPGQVPPQGAPQPQPGAAPAPVPGGAPAAGGNPWAARLAEAAQRFGGNRPSGGIMGGRGQ